MDKSRIKSTFYLLTFIILLFLPMSIEKLIPNILVTLLTGLMLRNPQYILPDVINQNLQWFGNRSYTLYLLHMPILYVAFFSPVLTDGFHKRFAKLIAIVGTVFLSFILSRYIESPYRNRYIDESTTKNWLRIQFSKFVLLPFLILSLISFASYYNYFGMDRNTPPLKNPQTMDPSCSKKNGEFPCNYPVEEKFARTALLIGDSHASHLSVAFTKAANSLGMNSIIWSQNGCQFILPTTVSTKFSQLQKIYSIRNRTDNLSCFAHNEKIINWLRMNSGVDVFVTHRSTSFPVTDYNVNPQHYNNLVIQNLNIIRNSAASVTLIGPNPEFPDSWRFFMGQTLFWQKNYENSAQRQFTETKMVQNPFIDDAYFKKRLENSKIQYLSTIEPFCNSRHFCNRFGTRGWLYTNADHLSLEGTFQLIPILKMHLQSHANM